MQTAELKELLRVRLRFLGLFGTIIYGVFTIFLAVPLLQGGTDPGTDYGFLILLGIGLLAVFGGLTSVLWSGRPLSLGQLRVIEAVAFGLVLANIAWERNADFGRFQLSEVLQQGPPVAPPRYATFFGMPFFALIITYGTFIPNTWRRASVIVGLMALLPLTLATAEGISEGLLSPQFVKGMIFPMALHLGVGMVLAIYGSHRITVLREESLVARRLGQYHLTSRLGAGGMGEVYLAEHALLRRPCVVKLIRSDRLGDRDSLLRFEREVQATATLTNWHTVEIFDYGHAADGTFYYVMEYLPGLNFEQLVQENGPLLAGRIVHLLRQICAALHEAHTVGLIHRDIKPGNIITGPRGGLPDVAKLLDFGLVQLQKFDGNAQNLTQVGVITGTPSYMSPEQASGKQDLDGRSDIYSLGAVGYFLLTGQPPFVRDSAMQVIAAHLCEPVCAPDCHRPDIPTDLQAIILKCLEKDRGHRFQSANDLDEALAHCACANEG